MKPVRVSMRTILTILEVCVGLWLFVDSVDGKGYYMRTSSGSSGTVCNNRKCLKRMASCVNNVCQCNGGVDFRGDFACYPPNIFHAELLNDPSAKSFARETFPVPVPCRYLFSHFKTTYTGWPGSTCEVVIHAFNTKDIGKVYVEGFDLAVRISTPISPSPIGDLSIRKFGTARSGVYTYKEVGAEAFVPDGPWDIVDPPVFLYMPGVVLRAKHDVYNNFVVVKAEVCGFTLQFRPYDLDYRKDQLMVPGLALSVDPQHDPVWLSTDKAIALVPEGAAGPTLTSRSSDFQLDPRHAMLHQIFTSGTVQNQPNGSPMCSAVAEVMTSCTNGALRRKAYEKCSFILKREVLARYLNDVHNGDVTLGLFKDCAQAFCTLSASLCEDVQVRLLGGTGLEEVDNFMNQDTCNF